MGILSLFGRRDRTTGITVDYSKDVALPRDAQRLISHQPVSSGVITLQWSSLVIRPMPRGVSYLDYKRMHPDACFADAQILESLLTPFVSKKMNTRNGVIERLLGDFSGQIFFLGTSFESRYEGKLTECFAYLNWKTYQPALRYMCPAQHPINHSVNCCALFVELNRQVA